MDAGTREGKKNLLLERHAIQSAAEINSFLLSSPCSFTLPSSSFKEWREKKLKSRIFTSIFLNKPHHRAQQQKQTASPNEVPMYSFTSLQQEEWRYDEKR